MIELATLPAAEQTERQIERLRGDARAHPGDAELQLHLASLLPADGRPEEAAAEFRELLTRNPDDRIWEQAGAALVRAEQYELAREFLRKAAPGRPAVRLDLAIALFFTEGPKQALEVIEKAPEGDRDVLLMKARILDAAGQDVESVLKEGLGQSMPRPQVAQQTVLLLLRHDRKSEALAFLDKAVRRYPDNADLLLTQAIVESLTDQRARGEDGSDDRITMAGLGSRVPGARSDAGAWGAWRRPSRGLRRRSRWARKTRARAARWRAWMVRPVETRVAPARPEWRKCFYSPVWAVEERWR